MLSVPTRTLDGDFVVSSTADSFFKGARKISIGDCALFKPPQELPPFIGIIQWLTFRGGHLHLDVNWLYRPTEVKLGKGILLEAAPNEVFYSFHKDEIPPASLLHPCKVAFLPKGVELSPGTPSFICWRVYDIAKKRLWWLNNRNYIDGLQEEVYLVLETQKKMHATVQSGSRSPKPANAPMLSSQVKSGSDSVQNSATSFSSHNKRRKRDHGDQVSEPVKRERSSKTGDGDSGRFKVENILKSEIANVTEKGGLVNTEGVEKLLQLMQPDGGERKIDLTSRSMLAGVITMTDKFDCLNRFVQLRGLSVFDEWLQEIHKGKIGDVNGSKEGDQSMEDFLFVLLRALDKLPVNLHALKTCNIGRSVNHLRTHKNLDIHKKARSLVDTWKKRVEAEMNIIDSKSGGAQTGSWPSKSRNPEDSHGGNRHPGVSSAIVPKNSVSPISASKCTSQKPFQGDSSSKSPSSSPGPMKSSALSPRSGKDYQPKVSVGGVCDFPSTPVREEKSSSSSQSHNYSQSLSGTEDARSSTAGSMCVKKISGSTSRHRKSSNGFPGTAVAGVKKETWSRRTTTSLQRGSTSERASGLTCEKALDVPAVEARSQKLIVKIPNRGRSPAESTSGGFCEDPSIMNSRDSSPVLSKKHDELDRSTKEKNDAYRANVTSDVNTESWQSNDLKDVLTGSDEGDVSPAAIHDEDVGRAIDDTTKVAEVSNVACSLSGNELKSVKLQEASFNSINVLIESCAKYSNTNASLSDGDDVGMNLLASVAAGQMSKSNLVFPTDSPKKRNHPLLENPSTGNESKLGSSPEDIHQRTSAIMPDSGKRRAVCGTSQCKGELSLSDNSVGERKTTISSSHEIPTGKQNEQFPSVRVDLQPTADQCLGTSEKNEMEGKAKLAVFPVNTTEKVADGKVSRQELEEKEAAIIPCCKKNMGLQGSDSLLVDDKASDVLANLDEDEKQTLDAQPSHTSFKKNNDDISVVNEGLSSNVHSKQKPLIAIMKTQKITRIDKELMHSSGTAEELFEEKHDELKVGKDDGMHTQSYNRTGERPNLGKCDTSTIETQESVGLGSVVIDKKIECMKVACESKEVRDQCSGEAVSHKESPVCSPEEKVTQLILTGLKATAIGIEEKEPRAHSAAYTSTFAAGASDVDVKPKFDLNEGFDGEDGKYGETSNIAGHECSSAHVVSPLPFPVSSVSGGLPASITVTAAAKGPFVPPEDLLRSKKELGWKGSAATSAFRPAEPRKSLDMPLGLINRALPDVSAGKCKRPVLDFDLNVADERSLEDLSAQESVLGAASTSDLERKIDLAGKGRISSSPGRGSGGFDLDLNCVVEANDMVQSSLTGNSCRLEPSVLQVKSSLAGGFPDGEVRRDFDLNNGPVLDDGVGGLSSNQHGRGSMQFQLPASGIRLNSAGVGNFSAWFHPGNTYSPATVPPIFQERGDKPLPIVASQRVVGSPTSCTPDIYRGSVLSSSPTLPFPSTPYQYPIFPFGAPFSLASTNLSGGPNPYMDSSSAGRISFPGINSQLLGPAGPVSSLLQRPYTVALADGSNNGGMENIKKWGRQGLDLNAGPGGLEIEGKDEILPLESRQYSVAVSQALADEQARMYGVLKRKEPEGSWDAENLRFKSPWQ